jgi:DNA primase
MARIKDESVEAVKATADIVTLVEGYTRLRKSGARFVGLCPFHQEKTPSFGVSPDRGSFKCFGCGEGGDAIAFVEKLENLDFVGAIEFLADRFNVPIEYEETSAGAGPPAAAARASVRTARAGDRVLRAPPLGVPAR